VICSRTDTPEATTLAIKGELDALSASDLRPIVEELVAENVRNVTVDLSELRLIDSSGVGAIVSIYKRVRAKGGRVSVTGLSGQPLAVMKLLRLEKVLAG
jgi:anti-sigma B factor antagonist